MAGGPDDSLSPPDVFVSYSRTDETRARQIIETLQQQGFTVWWDGLLEAGAVFTRSTEQALEQAKAVLVVWSAQSITSNWVRDEAQVGRDNGTLVPVAIDEIQPPLGFRQFQSVDLSRWNGAPDTPEMRSVCDALAKLVGEPRAGGQKTPATLYRSPAALAKNTRAPVWVVLGLVALAIAGAVYWLSNRPAAGETANSIAILPFDNLTGSDDQAYFATGLSEEMRQMLRQNAGLQVVGQTSTNEAAADDAGAETIATALGVRYLLDGSVRRSEETVRVTVQLIDGETGFDVWSETYERPLDDIFGVQSEIANQVTTALLVQVAGDNGSAARIGGTENPAAYDAYLRGRSLYDLALDESTDRAALRQFEIAVEADPAYGAAWAALARTQATIANSYPSDKPLTEAYNEAVETARHAVRVAPDLADAHAALGFVLLNGRLDANAAEQPYREAYRLGTGDADVLQSYATFAARIGDFDQAREAILRAVKLDPLNAVARRSQALIHFAQGDYAKAREAAEAALEMNPDMRVAHRILGDIAYLDGDYRVAAEEYRLEQSKLSSLPGLAMTLPKLGDAAGGKAALAQLQSEYGKNSLYQQAQVLAQTDRPDAALDSLEEAYSANDSGMVLMRNDPMFRPIADKPRFVALLRRMGFTPPT